MNKPLVVGQISQVEPAFVPGGFCSDCKKQNKAHPLFYIEFVYFQVVIIGLGYFLSCWVKKSSGSHCIAGVNVDLHLHIWAGYLSLMQGTMNSVDSSVFHFELPGRSLPSTSSVSKTLSFSTFLPSPTCVWPYRQQTKPMSSPFNDERFPLHNIIFRSWKPETCSNNCNKLTLPFSS